MAYLDDILIHSLTWEKHLKHLDIVINKLREAGLRIQKKKCTFANGYIVAVRR